MDESEEPQTHKQPTLLRVQDLGVAFPRENKVAFQGISFGLRAGESLAVIGPSGCGKSSLLKVLAGLVAPTEGSFAWEGNGPPEAAFIFQDPTLLPWLNTLHNIEIPLRLRGVDAANRLERAKEAMEQVLLQACEALYPRALSGGMRMRVSLARALTIQPALLFLDEPFAALDAITRNQMNQLLLDLRAQQGWTSILVTHAVAEAVYLSDRVLVMGGSPGTLLADVPITLPHPRGPELQNDPEYHRHVAILRSILSRSTEGNPQ
jgi:NitT/TauT family transport system ATP-binding protein